MILERKDDNYLRAIFPYKEGDNKFKFFFCSDIHIDHIKCKTQLFTDDLKRVQDAQGKFMIFGDFFCLMQGRADRRSNKAALRPELKTESYFQDAVEYGKDALEPFKENLICISDGNHETSVVKNIEINPIKMLLQRLNLDPAVQHMPYLGYIDLIFKNETENSTGSVRKQRIFYDHGGYHGEVSKGTLAIQRYAAMSNNADIVCSGDTHHRWINTHHTYDINQNTGKMFIREQLHLKCGTYKDEFTSGKGWAVEKIKFPKGLGGIFLDLEVHSRKIKRNVLLESIC